MESNEFYKKTIDIVLMLKTKQGNKKAFSKLFIKYRPEINRFFLHRYPFQTPYDAEDYTQEVFLRLWQRRENYLPKANLRSYLRRMARNLLNDQWRKRKRTPPHISLNRPRKEGDDNSMPLEIADKKSPDPAETLVQKEKKARIKEAIDFLPKKQREVLMLRDYDGLSYKEIAQITHCPLRTVYYRRKSALEKLRERLKSM